MVVKDEYGPGIADLVGINNNATSTFLGLPERPSMSAQFHAVDLTTTKSFYDTSDFATESAIYDQWDGGLRLLITSIPGQTEPRASQTGPDKGALVPRLCLATPALLPRHAPDAVAAAAQWPSLSLRKTLGPCAFSHRVRVNPGKEGLPPRPSSR